MSASPTRSSATDVPLSFSPSPFRPAWWLPGGHTQTIGALVLRSSHSLPMCRVRLGTDDGDFLDLDFHLDPESLPASLFRQLRRKGYVQPEPGEGFPGRAHVSRVGIVLLLHGLEGCSGSGYIVEAGRRLRRAGLTGVAMNFRSCSGEPNRLKRFYHSGDTGDLALVLRWMRARFPEIPLGVLGFSLGGSILLNYLGRSGTEARTYLEAAAAVSVPFDLSAGSQRLSRGSGRLYERFFLASLQRKLRRKIRRRSLPGMPDLPDTFRSLRDFDSRVTAPVHGFSSAQEYYDRASCRRVLPDVRVPTLVLQSRDDVFLPGQALPEGSLRDNPWILPVVTDRGGHCGFVTGPVPGRHRFWAEQEAVRFLTQLLSGGPVGTR